MDLTPVGAEWLPFRSTYAPRVVSIGGERVHVIIPAAAEAAAVDVVLDGQGRTVGAGTRLPITFVDDAVACGGSAVVVGRDAAGGASVVSLVGDGAPASTRALPEGEEAPRAPRLACVAGSPELVWLTPDRRLVWFRLSDGRTAIALDEPGIGSVAVAGGERGLAVVAATGGRLDLIRLVDGRIEKRVALVERSDRALPGIVRVDAGYALVWTDGAGTSLWHVLFSPDLDPVRAAAPIKRIAAPAHLAARLIAGERHAALVMSADVPMGDVDTGEGGHWAPAMGSHLGVFAYDVRTGELGPLHRLEPAGLAPAGAWIGDTLFVVHGDGRVVVSRFTRSSGRR